MLGPLNIMIDTKKLDVCTLLPSVSILGISAMFHDKVRDSSDMKKVGADPSVLVYQMMLRFHSLLVDII